MLSPDFYASDFIWNEELPRAKRRWAEGKLTIIPVRVRASYDPKVPLYQWLRDEQQVPRDKRSVTSSPNRDEAWREVIVEIDRTIEKVLEQRASGIANRSEVDTALADAGVALKGALDAVRQVPVDLGGVSRDEIESALTAAKAALGADTAALRDEVASAYSRLRRCKFARDEHGRLSQALANLRDQLMAVFESAGAAGFTSRVLLGIPSPVLIPQAKVAEARGLVETRLGELEVRVKDLERHREGTIEAAVADAAIDQVVEGVGEQTGLARELLSEPEVDVAGVDAAIEGAARVVARFVRRAAGFASAAVRTIAAGLDAAAAVLAHAGRMLVMGAIPGAGVPSASSAMRSPRAETGSRAAPPGEWVAVDDDTFAKEEALHKAEMSSGATLEEILAAIRKSFAKEDGEVRHSGYRFPPVTREASETSGQSDALTREVADLQIEQERLPVVARESAESMRHAISDQLKALEQLSSLSARARRDVKLPTPPPPAGDISIASIARALDGTTAWAIWSRFRAGESGIMERGVYTNEGRALFDEITRRYGIDFDFRRVVDRFLVDFEWLIRDIEQKDASGRTVYPHLISESGRVYLFLAHASGRLR